MLNVVEINKYIERINAYLYWPYLHIIDLYTQAYLTHRKLFWKVTEFIK